MSRDEGTVMMLVLGLIPILAGMIAVGADAAVLFTHRRALASHADAAALAAAQTADLEALYAAKELTELPLDCESAQAVANERLTLATTDVRASRVSLVDFRCSAGSVSVRLNSQVELPFASHFGVDPVVEVNASAAARSPLR